MAEKNVKNEEAKDKEMQYNYLLNLENDIRDEVKKRVAQRDSFAVQCIVAAGVLIGLSITESAFAPYIILLFPLIAFFYINQINHSYAVHAKLMEFIVDKIEVDIKKLYNGEKSLGWNNYAYKEEKKNKDAFGKRRNFFNYVIYFIPFVSVGIFFAIVCCNKILDNNHIIVGATAVIFYYILVFILTFHKKAKKPINKK